MTDYPDTYYSRTLRQTRERPAQQGAIDTDVCVIGGGLAGINVGLGLAERGKKAVVLEGRRIGFGASGRNGGKVLTGYAAGFDKIAARVGAAQARELEGLTWKSLELVRRRIKDFRIDCDLTDGVMIASWYDDPAALQADREFETTELGLRVEFVPREELRELYLTRRYYDGLFYPDYFHIHVLEYLHGLTAAFESKGGIVFENSMALHVKDEGGRLVVTTEQGTVRADHVVYCTSAYSNGIERRLQWASLPVSSYMVATPPLPQETLARAIRARYGVYDTRWALDYYRISPDNRIVWGGGVGLGSHRVPRHLKEKMLRSILHVYPQLQGIQIDTAWTGTMASTGHRMPHIGRFTPNIWYSTNYGNNGLGPTATGGEAIAAAIAQGDETYKLFEPFGLEYAAGFLGPYIAQGVYRSWQLRDIIKQWKSGRKNTA